MKRFLTLLIFLSSLQCLRAQVAEQWTWGGPIDELQARYEVERYTLKLEFFPETEEIRGSNTIKFECKTRLDTLRLDLIDQYTVSKVTIYEEEVDFTHDNDILDVYIPDGCASEVTVFYGGKTPIAVNPPWSGGFTWTQDEEGNHWMGLSSQNEGAKIFMPAKDHPSSEPTGGVELHLTAPAPYFVAANGRLVQQEEVDGKITYRWNTNYPINNYNINFTLGKFHAEEKEYISVDGNTIPMVAYVLEENKDKAPMLLKVLETSTKTHEEYFGEFPFPDDKIAVVETPYLGMEHQTINGYGNNFQFVPMNGVFHDWLLHHELGHEWFGNKVSVGDWADFWIHEGLTAYGDWLFYRTHAGEEAYLQQVRNTKRNISNQQPIVPERNATAKEAYHPEIYTKGAFVVHSLRFMVGDEVFFPMIKAFANDERFTYQNRVNTQDFVDFVEGYSEKDLKGFFELYLYTTNLPEIKVKKAKGQNYRIWADNIDFVLPVEIETSEGIKVVELSKEPVEIASTTQPAIDPNDWFLLKK